ncbi:MAG: ATP-binding protein [Gammaproteobacteria bacterium]|nr:ATP-binding protein [Gammaproteobacteria bacterium]
MVLDRTRLESELEQARIVSETEQLRAALLSSVSHDLRTPLASIIGSTTSLIEYGDTIRPGDRLDLLNTVVTEARRLDRYIQNLPDMTRLGQGKLHLARDWVDLADVVSSAVSRVRAGAGGVSIDVAIEPGLPLMWIHGVLIEQALVNLVDNAVKHSPTGTAVSVRARRGAGTVVVEVIDRGPGIAVEEREKIFDMFYTIRRGDSGTQGTGLGLAICRGWSGLTVARFGQTTALTASAPA